MEFSAKQISELLNGKVEGNPSASVNDLSKIEEGKPGTLTFLANPKYESFIYTTGASIAIVNNDFEPEASLPEGLTLVKVANAYESFSKLLSVYEEMAVMKPGISDSAVIDDSAEIGENVYIGPGVFVGPAAKVGAGTRIYAHSYIGRNTKVGENCIFHPGVKVLTRCIVGNSCTFHSGIVIGGDGFGFSPNQENNYQKVPQIGNVIIEDHVEIGANSTIDRATLGSTIIRKGVKIDNLIQIAHNVEIGENTVIAAQTGIAGSTKIGKNCMIGGQVGIVGHLTIADEVKIAAQSGVGSSITTQGTIVQGSPAFGIGNYKKAYVGFRKLPELMSEIHALKKQCEELANKINS